MLGVFASLGFGVLICLVSQEKPGTKSNGRFFWGSSSSPQLCVYSLPCAKPSGGDEDGGFMARSRMSSYKLQWIVVVFL